MSCRQIRVWPESRGLHYHPVHPWSSLEVFDVMGGKSLVRLLLTARTKGVASALSLWPSIRSDQISRSVVSNSLRPYESQHARPPCPSPTPGVHPDSHPLSQWCQPAMSFSVIPFSSCPNPSQHQSLFQWVNSSHEVAKVLEFQLYHQSFHRTPRTDLL